MKNNFSVRGADIVNKINKLYTDPSPKIMKIAMARCLYDELLKLKKEQEGEENEQEKAI